MDLAQLIIALTGLGGMAGGFYLSRRAQRQSERETTAARALEERERQADSLIRERETKLAETQQALDAQGRTIEALNKQCDRANQENELLRERLQAANERYYRETERASQRAEQWAQERDRMEATARHLAEAVSVLQGLVSGEMQAAAQTVVEEASSALKELPIPLETEGEDDGN